MLTQKNVVHYSLKSSCCKMDACRESFGRLSDFPLCFLHIWTFFFFTNMLQLTIFLHKDCWIFKKNLYWCLKQRSFHPSCLPLDSQDRTDSVVHAMGSTSLSGPINERHFNIIRTTSVVWNYIDPSENLCCLNIWMQYRYRLIIFRNKQALC